jgi:peptide/nickel transport system substrate-binding protein
MKHTVCPFHAGNNLRAALVALFALGATVIVPNAEASTRPQIGGTLRVQLSGRVATIDPRQWSTVPAQAAAIERVDSLIFDRLIRLDESGALRPALALYWQQVGDSKHWRFRIRDGVKFSDGSPLTPPVAAMALQQLLGSSFDVSASLEWVVVQADRPLPDLPLQLAGGRYFIFRTLEDNSLTGTGPFRVTEWTAAAGSAKAVFIANENCWAGRPFVDKIELTMGEIGRAHV